MSLVIYNVSMPVDDAACWMSMDGCLSDRYRSMDANGWMVLNGQAESKEGTLSFLSRRQRCVSHFNVHDWERRRRRRMFTINEHQIVLNSYPVIMTASSISLTRRQKQTDTQSKSAKETKLTWCFFTLPKFIQRLKLPTLSRSCW